METPAEFSDKSPAAMHDDAVLRAIAEGVEAETADRFFSSRARHLALALEVQYAFVSHLSDDGTRFKILALWERDHFGPNLEIPLTGTPCESVLHGESAHYSTDLCARFPDDQYRWFLVQYRPVHDEHGKLVRWYATGTDIDDQKQVELRLADQNAYLLDELRTEQNFGDLVGGSSGLRKVMRQVQLVAPTDATVLITGESGTGKELIARAIHEEGARSGRPLIKLNCSAVPEGLFESEFFGHVKGAFTGALKDKPGRFELADGGTHSSTKSAKSR
jgi:hypothetical protein